MNRVAIVTGSARGIGAAVAGRLLEEGIDVAVLDIDPPAAERAVAGFDRAGGRATAVAVDVSDADSVREAVDEVADRLGPPGILVNNAGVTRDSLVFSLSPADWDLVIDVNLRGTFLMTQAVTEHMAKLGWGRVVNLSSIAAVGNAGQANYSAAKAGIEGLTKTLAMELGPLNVTVNAVAPGYVATEMTAALAAKAGHTAEEHQARVAATIPLRRVGQPKDIAHLVAFLASDHASFVSGQIIHVAGGPVC
ncbi:beta-ketoacyl-ACP reductase [Amycolatopsis sp. WAC 01375]|uniref:3-oxoacyl-ACP reductase FabG n=1 Tax=Amycolatopsis sp. WAC 01375 TaxID=2203194 RepID=UPI000F7AA766|nr:3-oxoacyl-ACP reductase FabG [Amycolatopsis sp. WAC 01375]RSM75220.1 beta-ketoacyl-ACP reductase [Amycolatopsis sp. WAC 01375]